MSQVAPSPAEERLSGMGAVFALWYGMLGGAIAWKLQLMVNYAVVPYACWHRVEILNHLASLATFLLALAYKGHWTRERCQGVKVNGLYWHFVVVIWIPLYITIYWTPRIHG